MSINWTRRKGGKEEKMGEERRENEKTRGKEGKVRERNE